MHLTEISENLGFSKSTTHGLIQALLKVGALDQSPYQKKVFLGASSKVPKSLTISSSPGSRIPLMAGAVGKAFLAARSNSEALKILRKKGLKRYTQGSVVDEAAYLKELKWVRRNGYALDNEEYLVGVKAVAANLGNFRSLPLLMWVVGFASAMTGGQSPGIVEKTLAAAQKIRFALKSDKPAISSDFPGR